YTPVLAKHSKNFSLEDSLAIGVDRMQRNIGPLKQQVEDYLYCGIGSAARSGLSSPQSDASYASRRIAAEVLMGRCLEAKGAQFVQRLLPAKNASVHASETSCHM
ncbi:MAG TPA: hypothetical protein VII29_16495, partial [Terriglobales bacterium]